MMPISSTAMIKVLSGGLALNATRICWWITNTISAPRIRNTDIRTRKMRGEETLNGSISRAMFCVAPWLFIYSPKHLIRASLWHGPGESKPAI